ncbi:MAG: Fe-S protein [Verrucomicrobiaceae bacterium]|nr:Fe-S protein [Verrucomicrobiaceae bacterium]
MAEKLPTRIPTPCIGVCSTGIGDNVCRGCKRYAAEVIYWNSYTEEQKRAINRRLDQLLSQVVAAKATVFDAALLESKLKALQLQYSPHRSPLVWVFELLRAGARQIVDTTQFGFALEPAYKDINLLTLRDQIDQEFFLLSEAHYQRYVGVV